MTIKRTWFFWLATLATLASMRPATALAATPATTTVSGVIYNADGSVAQGMLIISWRSFTAADGTTIAAGQKSLPIGADGRVSVALSATTGATPSSYYVVTIKSSNGTTSQEYWAVPEAANATVASVRSTITPTATAVQFVSRDYIDTQISTLLKQLPFAGNTRYAGASYTAGNNIQAAITDAGANGIVIIPANYAGADSYVNPNGILILDERNGQLDVGRTAVLKDGNLAVDPESNYFGAKGDGVADDTAALTNANAYAAALGMPLYLPHSYVVTSPMLPAAPWIGVKGKSKIIISSGFMYSTNMATNQGAIYNPHFAKSYSDATADAMRFEGITFVNNAAATSGGQRETMIFSNVSRLVIKDCAFTSSGSLTVTDLDIYGPVRNALIQGNSFTQSTGAATGGNIWILGLGATSADYTQNIHITDNTFVHASSDEAIAINNFGAAPVTDIYIDHFTLIESGADSVAFSIVANGNASYPSRYLKNVHVSDFTITTTATKNYAMRIGVAGETAGATSDVYVNNGAFRMASSSALTAAVYVPTAYNVHVDNNTFANSGSTITYAIMGTSVSLGSLYVSGNYIGDTFTNAMGYVGSAKENTINMTTGNGIRCAALAVRNVITTAGPAINCDVSGTYTARDNIITLLSTAAAGTAAIYGYGYNSSQTISFVLDANTVTLANATHYVYSSAATNEYTEMRNNVALGAGSTVGAALAVAQNNSWYGQKDDFATATSSLPASLVAKLPAGFIVRSSSPSSGVLGWQLTTPLTATWKTLTSADGYMTLSPTADQTLSTYGLIMPYLRVNNLYTTSNGSGILNAACGNSNSSPQYGVCFQVQRPSDFAYVFRTTINKQVLTANNTLDDGSGNMLSSGTLGLKNSGYYGTLTPATLTAARSYTLPDASGSIGLVLSSTSGSIGGSALNAGACANSVLTVSGATTSMSVTVTPSGYPGDGVIWHGYVAATNMVLIKVCNYTTASVTPTATTYNVRVIQ